MGPFWARAHGARAQGPGPWVQIGPMGQAMGPDWAHGPIKCRFCQRLAFFYFYEKDAARLYDSFAPNGAPRSLI